MLQYHKNTVSSHESRLLSKSQINGSYLGHAIEQSVGFNELHEDALHGLQCTITEVDSTNNFVIPARPKLHVRLTVIQLAQRS